MREQLGRYRLERKLGDGGVGDVYLASAAGVEGFRKPCVIKLLQPRFAKDPQVISMFLDEARLVAELVHANIAQVYELGRIDEQFFIAMEYVVGQPLSMVIRVGRQLGRAIPPEIALRIVAGVCEGLEFAHAYRDEAGKVRGIVHGDISPHNVMLSADGVPKLIDFGVARALGDRTTATDAVAMGKIPYLAPELFEGRPPSYQSDVYAVGIVLYELLAGKRPFRDKTTEGLIREIRAGAPAPIELLRQDLPPHVGELVRRAMATEPRARFSSAAELAQACEETLFQQRWLVTPQRLSSFLRELLGPAWRLPERTEAALELKDIIRIEDWRRELAPSGVGDTLHDRPRAEGPEDGATSVDLPMKAIEELVGERPPAPVVLGPAAGPRGSAVPTAPVKRRSRDEVTLAEEVDLTGLPRLVPSSHPPPPAPARETADGGADEDRTEEMSADDVREVQRALSRGEPLVLRATAGDAPEGAAARTTPRSEAPPPPRAGATGPDAAGALGGSASHRRGPLVSPLTVFLLVLALALGLVLVRLLATRRWSEGPPRQIDSSVPIASSSMNDLSRRGPTSEGPASPTSLAASIASAALSWPASRGAASVGAGVLQTPLMQR